MSRDLRHRGRRTVAAAVAGLAVALSLAGAARPAGAQTYGPQPLGITCSLSIGTSGISLVCTTSGFQPGAAVAFTIYSTPMSLGSVAANASGQASLNAALPTNLAGGDHRVEATGTAATGGVVTVATTVTLPGTTVEGTATGSQTSRALPRTGFPVGALASAGSALVAVGALLVFTTRRRRRQAPALAG